MTERCHSHLPQFVILVPSVANPPFSPVFKSKIQNQKSSIGNHQSAIINRQSSIGNRQSAIGNRQSAIGNQFKG
jgi:hypothetical protein